MTSSNSLKCRFISLLNPQPEHLMLEIIDVTVTAFIKFPVSLYATEKALHEVSPAPVVSLTLPIGADSAGIICIPCYLLIMVPSSPKVMTRFFAFERLSAGETELVWVRALASESFRMKKSSFKASFFNASRLFFASLIYLNQVFLDIIVLGDSLLIVSIILTTFLTPIGDK